MIDTIGIGKESLRDNTGNYNIAYGNSSGSNNASEIFGKPDVDGGLIGGAALDAKSFVEIVNAF